MSALTLNLPGQTSRILQWIESAKGSLESSTVEDRSRMVSDTADSHNHANDASTASPATSSHSDLTDEQLLVAYREGDREAFVGLVDRYRTDLMHFLIRFLGSRAAAEDVFQEAFLQVHLSMDSFDEQRRFKPWLFTIAANKARDHHRRRKRRDAVSLSTPIGKSEGRDAQIVDLLECDSEDADANILSEERGHLVKQVVDGMPAHYREILLLSYFQRMSYNQISESLNIPLGTVKSRLHASVANFAEAWKAARGESMDDDATRTSGET